MLNALENLIKLARDRKSSPVEGSYTNKLLTDKPLSKAKVLEEVNEKANKVYENTNFIKPEDIGETIYWIATRPKNINVNRIEIMAGLQAFNPFKIIKND